MSKCNCKCCKPAHVPEYVIKEFYSDKMARGVYFIMFVLGLFIIGLVVFGIWYEFYRSVA